MATTLLNCEVLFSQDIGDFWEGTTTSATAAGTITDTSLQDLQQNDWISNVGINMYDMITSGSVNEEERAIASFNATNGQLVLARSHSGSIASGVTYRVHRLASASDKRRALVIAKDLIFGECYDLVWDEAHVSGNWLRDGSFEIWNAAGTALDYWTESVIVPVKTTTAGLFKHGTASALLAGTIGSLEQSITDYDDLKRLAGQTVTFSMQGRCNTASCLRLSINDGSTQTYSNYHGGGTSWTQDNPRNDNLYAQQFIDYNPTQITFAIHHEIGGGTSYVDDARVIGPYQPRIYIGDIAFAQNKPNAVYIEPFYYSDDEPWDTIHDWEMDEDGYLHLPSSVPRDYRLRIVGKQYLDFIASGASSTSWSATINMNEPQTRVLSAEAAVWLYNYLSNIYDSGERGRFRELREEWKRESRRRKAKFGMPEMPITVSWGHD